MTLNVAIQMDPLESINPRSDSTLLMGIEATRRGHAVRHYTPDKLSWRDGKITAQAVPVKFHAGPTHYFDLGKPEIIDLAEMDVVLLRQDPPFNMTYLTTTYILEKLPTKTLVVNNPSSVRNLPEKLFPMAFRQFMPPTLVSADIEAIADFRREHGDIIIKPLYGYGGRSVLRVKKDDGNFAALLEMQFAGGQEPVMVQKFLPEVATGDRRIILIDGKFMGTMGRIPAEGEIRANFRVGGTAARAELTPAQKTICDVLGPVLKERGIVFAGIDCIGDRLTEINITSPTGMVAMNGLYGLTLERDLWDAIEQKR